MSLSPFDGALARNAGLVIPAPAPLEALDEVLPAADDAAATYAIAPALLPGPRARPTRSRSCSRSPRRPGAGVSSGTLEARLARASGGARRERPRPLRRPRRPRVEGRSTGPRRRGRLAAPGRRRPVGRRAGAAAAAAAASRRCRRPTRCAAGRPRPSPPRASRSSRSPRAGRRAARPCRRRSRSCTRRRRCGPPLASPRFTPARRRRSASATAKRVVVESAAGGAHAVLRLDSALPPGRVALAAGPGRAALQPGARAARRHAARRRPRRGAAGGGRDVAGDPRAGPGGVSMKAHRSPRAPRATGWSWTSTAATAAARARWRARSRTTCRRPPSARPSATGSRGCASSAWPTRTARRAAYVPMMCQQCGDKTPCASVCPQNAVEVDPGSGIVAQVPVRCLGCRYCMAACPYHARSFNWWDPEWPGRLTETLNPDVSTRTRGVVEKCTLCAHRLQEARQRQAAEGGDAKTPVDYVPACAEACPAGAITFGNLDDPRQRGRPPRARARVLPPAREARDGRGRLLPHREGLGPAPRGRRAGRRRREASWIASLVARGKDRAPFPRFLLWLVPWTALLGRRALRRVAVPRRRPQPDEHGQPLRVRPLDLPRPHGDRARRGRLLHGLPPLRAEEEGAARPSSTARS